MIGALLNVPSSVLTARVFEALQGNGFGDVTSAQRAVFSFIDPDGNRVTELARRAGMTKQSMGYLVAQLERSGYLESVPDESDGRATIVRRTPKGWLFNRAAADEVRRIQREWTRLLGREKMASLTALLSELTEKLGYRFEGSHVEVASRMGGRARAPTSTTVPAPPGSP